MTRFRAFALRGVAATAVLITGAAIPAPIAGAEPPVTVTAYLDGVPIPLRDVSRYYCDDLSYPVISCSRSGIVATTRTTLLSLLGSVEYVTIYDFPGYAGSFMNVSQDYSILALLGWNDKISSFRGRNSETGSFHTDWLYGGSTWNFCCNQLLPSLGAYDNTFSSVKRT